MKKKSDEQQSKNPVAQAVRELRTALGESQQAFAYRMKTAIRTIARYETVRPPKGRALAELQQVATDTGHPKLANIFKDALVAELGTAGHFAHLGGIAYVVVPGIRDEVGQISSALKDENTAQEVRIEQAIKALNAITATMAQKFRNTILTFPPTLTTHPPKEKK
jgi:transcriptional regulator with XRE-family HTH domain